jgi:hypothetical protein
VVWALNIIWERKAKYPGVDIDYTKALMGERYVHYLNALGVGSIDNRTQFLGSMVLFRSMMHKLTRSEDGDGEGATKVETHIPNAYSDNAKTLIAQKANGVSTPVSVAKLFEPTANSATDQAMMEFFSM